MTPEALMLAVGKQVDSQLQKNPALVFNTPEYNAKRSELIAKEMQRLQALGVGGLEGLDASTIGGAGGSQQVYDFTNLTGRKP